jgi:polyribonucleotide nucleotidyltransferase
MIFLSKSIESSLMSAGILRKIEDQVGDVKVFFQYEFTIPDLDGFVLNIKSDDIRKKRDATQNLLEFIVKNNIDDPSEEGKKHSERISVLVMVPNGLISMIIGTKGRQISNLIKDSGANIVVNQPIYKMMHRTVAISGKPSNVASAIMMIQTIMEDRFFEVSKVEMEFKPLNVTTTQTHVQISINSFRLNLL